MRISDWSSDVCSSDLFGALKKLDDETAIEVLDALPGIGRWTAEMFLMFAMQRLDLFAMDDVGLRRGINMLYNKGKPVSEARTLKITRKWAPYRSVASWYLWRVADPVNEIRSEEHTSELQSLMR